MCIEVLIFYTYQSIIHLISVEHLIILSLSSSNVVFNLLFSLVFNMDSF